jgi:hypothetical protein
MKLLKESHIVAATIPSHSSHILQPLDCGVNLAFKQALARLTRKVVSTEGTSAHRKSLLIVAHQAAHTAFYSATILQAWKAAGLFPWCPQRIANDESKVHTDVVVTSCRGSVVSGVILTSEVVMRDLERIQEEKKQATIKKEEQKKIKLERELKREMMQAAPNSKQGDQMKEPAQKKKRGRPPKACATASGANDRDSATKAPSATAIDHSTAPQF